MPGIYRAAGTGRMYWGAGDTYTFLITGEESDGAYFTMLAEVPPGGGPPPHIHHREEEQFYILEGVFTFRLGKEIVQASSGDFVHVPRGTIHNFKNEGVGMAKLLISYTPAGLEKLFMEVFTPVTDPLLTPPPMTPESIARFMSVEVNYGMESLLPDDPRLSD